jgi:hypothetical protein
MAAANDIRLRRGEIHNLIAEDCVAEAIKRLMDYVRDFAEQDQDPLNEAIVISASFKRLEKAERQGILDFDKLEQKRNRLLYQLLELMDNVTGQASGLAS